ncbi:MAG: hypothetical protein O2894_00625 [Planctomycetota bacterium]|nr:hypothetical protein [Planctomycetota bacterium]
MIRPLPHCDLPELFGEPAAYPRAFPILDRAFDAVERALDILGVEDPASLRSPRPVEELLSPTALPEGTLLVLDPAELRTAEVDVEDTVKDERLGGSVFLSLPHADELGTRARSLRELAAAATTFGFNASLNPLPVARVGRVRQVATPLHLRNYRFLLADTPGFRVAVVARALPSGGFIGLWTGEPTVLNEMRTVLAECAEAPGHSVPRAAPPVPVLDGVESERDVWKQAEDLRAFRVVREAQLREIARAAALRGVALRREREAKRVKRAATGS